MPSRPALIAISASLVNAVERPAAQLIADVYARKMNPRVAANPSPEYQRSENRTSAAAQAYAGTCTGDVFMLGLHL
jgi:hypothetical protein